MLPKIIIITLNWNGSEDTIELIKSLKKNTFGDFQIFIVDNNSIPEEVAKLIQITDTSIQLIKLNENLGFAGGNNFGIKKALEEEADFILLINNDTIVEPNFLEPLLGRFKPPERVGIVAPQINYYDKQNIIWSAGGKISAIRGSGFAVSDKMETEIDYVDKPVGFVSGCCMLVKSDVFRSVGLFDENFFLYAEDTDFCYRVTKAGYKIFVTPESKIFHKFGQSTKETYSTLPLYYTTRNRLYFSRKNFPLIFPLTVFYISASMILKCIYWIITSKRRNISAVFRAFNDFIAGTMGKVEHNYFVD